jgi:hypothetical protein
MYYLICYLQVNSSRKTSAALVDIFALGQAIYRQCHALGQAHQYHCANH